MTTCAPTALITGGSRGIGLGIATHLASRGWALTLNARGADRLKEAQHELERLGGTVQIVASDLADEVAADDVVASHEREFGSMNALILAAGVGYAAALDGYPMHRFDKQFAVNLRAPFTLVSQALPLLRAGARALPERGGRVVALASLEGVYPDDDLAAYGASKAALVSLVRSINAEEGANGITASAISPGYVHTDMSAWVSETVAPDTMISVADIVKVVELVLGVSPNAVLPHIIVNRARAGAYHA
jgi:NAD(P)-dependent dehydrogenase (short-subunit alcohol dehydrogenase family)